MKKSVIDTTTLIIVDNRALFLWEWTWVDGKIESEHEVEKTVIPETPPDLSDEDDMEMEGSTEVVQ